MRRHPLLSILLLAALVSPGCSSNSSNRRVVGTPFTPSRSVPTLQQYDADPPAQSDQRKATTTGPSAPVPPAPPARGVSHVQGISLSRIFGYPAKQDDCGVDAPCAASTDTASCTNSGCTDAGNSGVGPCLANCWAGLKTRLTYWPKSTGCGTDVACSAPHPDECTPDVSCRTPARGTFCPQGCDDRDCTPQVEYHVPSRRFCPPQQSACVPEYRATERYCAPACPKALADPECGSEGCASFDDRDERGPRPGVLSSLFCFRGPDRSSANCGPEGCTTYAQPGNSLPHQQRGPAASTRPYGYGVAGEDPGMSGGNSRASYPPTSPTVQPDSPGSPLSENSSGLNGGTVPAVPATPQRPVPGNPRKDPVQQNRPQPGVGRPQLIDEVPQAAPSNKQPLSPMPQTSHQRWVEPSAWPKLNTPSLAKEHGQQNFYQPSSWNR